MKMNLVMGLIDKITSPIRKVTKGTTDLAEKVKASQSELKKLGATTKDIEHFRKLKAATLQSSEALTAAKAKAADLARQMQQTQNPTRKLTAEFKRAQAEVTRLSSSHQREQTELQQLRSRLQGAGVSTKNLTEATRQIREQTSKYNRELEKNQNQLDRTASKQKELAKIRERNSELKTSAATDMIGVAAAVYGVKSLADAYGEVSLAQGEIKSLGIKDDGIKAITKAAREFSSEFRGTTTTDFIKASYDIKSGIASLSDEAVGGFTRIAALTATGTKASVGTMTDLFATGYSIYREQFNQFGASVIKDWDKLSTADQDMEFGKYFSAGISASVQQFKTDGDKISQFMSTLGASATQAKQSFAEQLAVGGMLSATFQGGQAATKYQSFLASAGKASEALGIQVHDANGNLLSTGEILSTISDKYGGVLTDMDKQELTKAFGTKEAVDMIDMLLPKIGELQAKTGVMQGELKKGMATTMDMANAIGKGPGAAMDILKQKIFNVSSVVGELFAPALVVVADVLGGFASGLGSFIENFPVLSQVIAFAVVGLIALKTASIVARFGFAMFSDTLITARKVMDFFTLANLRAKGAMLVNRVAMLASATATTVMTVASKGAALATLLMTGAMKVFNLVMKANPIMLVVSLIAMLAAWGLSLVKDWSPVTGFFSALWDGVKSAFSGAWELFKTILSWSPIGLLFRAWGPLTSFFSGVFGGIGSVFSGAWALFKTILSWSPIGLLFRAWGPLTSFFSGLWDGITAVFNAPLDAIRTLLSWTPLGLIVQAWDPLLGFFSGLWENIKSMASGFIDWLVSAVMGPVNDIMSAIGEVWDWFTGDSPQAEVIKTVRQAAPPPMASPLGLDQPVADGGYSPGVMGDSPPMMRDPMQRPVVLQTGFKQPAAAPSYVDQSQTHFAITAAPGMDSQEIAREVQRKLDERDRQHARRGRGRQTDV